MIEDVLLPQIRSPAQDTGHPASIRAVQGQSINSLFTPCI
jgi:hypothetical protein